MTGPEHYRRAETLLGKIADYLEEDREDATGVGEWAAIAQVHATLAHAAATALTQFGEFPARDCEAWLKAASGEPWRAQ